MNYRQRQRMIRTYTIAFTKRANKLEKIYAPQFKKALDQQVRDFFDYAEKYGLPEALQLIDNIVTDAPLRPVMRALYITEGRKEGVREQQRLNKLYGDEVGQQTKSMEFYTNWIQSLTAFFDTFGFQAIVRITETTRDAIRSKVQKGMEDLLTLPQIRDQIISLGFNKNRSNVIARTEVISSLNNANYQAAKGSKLKFMKRWSSTHDKRTRHSHVRLDGETVALDTPFSNNGMYPGDPSLPGKERIQCRCTAVNEPLRDANGRLVRN